MAASEAGIQRAGAKYCRWFTESSAEAGQATLSVRQLHFISYRRRPASGRGAASELCRTSNSMLDWPEHSQMSPKATSRYTSEDLAVSMRSSAPTFAGRCGTRTHHWPRLLATASRTSPSTVTFTFSRASAVPRIRKSFSRGRTMWSENIGDTCSPP